MKKAIRKVVEAFKAGHRFAASGKQLGSSVQLSCNNMTYNLFINDDAITVISGILPSTPCAAVVAIETLSTGK